MSHIHNNGENDKSLDESLDTLGRAYDRLPHDEPPELLDQAILNSARRAVEKKPHWLKFGWLQGLTTAAVFVLALSIIVNQREQVPLFESGGRDGELGGLQREKVSGKQSAKAPSADMRMELKEKSDIRQDALKGAPASAAAEIQSAEADITNQAPQPATVTQRSLGVQESVPAKTDSVDADATRNEAVLGEPLADEAHLVVDKPEAVRLSKRARDDVEAEYVAGEAGVDAETEIGSILQNIIRLRESGDKAWVTELELFKQNYPDYPLPEALSD